MIHEYPCAFDSETCRDAIDAMKCAAAHAEQRKYGTLELLWQLAYLSIAAL